MVDRRARARSSDGGAAVSGRSFVSRFSPTNRTDPGVLERIFVQRQQLAKVWLDRLRDGITGGAKRHLLAVGPRGSGKSHLAALLVHRLRQDKAVAERVRVARLPEDETTPSFWKFLLRILRALHAEYVDEFAPFPPRLLNGTTDDRRGDLLVRYLLEKLAGRTLLVVVENLDDVMRGLKPEGQKRWRAFLQAHPVAITLATAQQLTKDLSDRQKPFFAFFEVENLQPLNLDEALSLLRNLAKEGDDEDLVKFLSTPVGRARVRAVRHITGGSHRIFIIMSEFVTRRSLDNLVVAFEELLDELTPYYQERLRWLPDQQREIVEFLCRQTRTAQVKDIAEALYLTEQAAAAQLKGLKTKGYVISTTVGRESRYELAEPMMRLCIEVKDPQREPIRLIVEFLRIWYDQGEATTELQGLAAGAELERQYLTAVLQAHTGGVPGPVEEALEKDLEEARRSGSQEELVGILVEFSMTAPSAMRCVAIAKELSQLDRHREALEASDRATQLDPKNGIAWHWKTYELGMLDRYGESLCACEIAIVIQPDHAISWNNKGAALLALNKHEEALRAFERAISLDAEYVHAWVGKAMVLSIFKRYTEALATSERAIVMEAQHLLAWRCKSEFLRRLGRYEESMVACAHTIEFAPGIGLAWVSRGRLELDLRQYEEAIRDFHRAVELDGAKYNDMHDSLAEAYILSSMWDEARKVLCHRFQHAYRNSPLSAGGHLPDCIAAIFRASTARESWPVKIGLFLACAQEALNNRNQTTDPTSDTTPSKTDPPSNPFALIADALVRSLRHPAYEKASPAQLAGWAAAWHDATDTYPDLSLAARLFEVGTRYVATKDERVLLDLLQGGAFHPARSVQSRYRRGRLKSRGFRDRLPHVRFTIPGRLRALPQLQAAHPRSRRGGIVRSACQSG